MQNENDQHRFFHVLPIQIPKTKLKRWISRKGKEGDFFSFSCQSSFKPHDRGAGIHVAAAKVRALLISSMIIANSSQKSGYFQHLKQSDQIFSGSSVRWTSWNPIASKKSFWYVSAKMR